jgi:hypothetical protein
MNIRHVAVLAVVLAVAGCGSKEKAESAAGDVRAKQAAAPEAVVAVLQSTGVPPVAKMGFVLLAAPVVGSQSALRLEVSSAVPVPALQVSVEGSDITVDPATAHATLAVEADKTATHELRFTPQREGLADVTVRLRAGTDGAETVYSVPVMAAKPATGA